MNVSLEAAFLELAGRYTSDSTRAQKLWMEIQERHSEPHRYYHTLTHLAQISAVLAPVWEELQNKDAVAFALFYHDSIYNPQSAQNEEDSAGLAHRRLQEIGMPAATIQKCNALIVATKAHPDTNDWDTDLFTDADLSILGAPPEAYENYAKAVRAEYAIYDDAAYAGGRAKVLEHFLHMKRIFKTDYFFAQLELKARENLEREREQYL